MIVLAGARVVTPSGVIDPGWVKVENATIAAIGNGRPPSDRVVDLGGAWLLPGYVDLHVHGGDGGRIDESAEGLAAAVALHRAHGTTRTLASVVTGPVDAMCAAAGWVADAVEAGPRPEGHVVGVHFEGPFIAAARCGAQNVDAMLEPDPATLARLIEAARGTARMITIAPELKGGIDLVRQAVEAGLVAAVGHTDAHYEQAMAAFDAGATVLTHAFNGMRGLHHRDPGSIGAAADSPQIVCEAINDGFHLHDAALRLLTTIAPGRVALITDAMAAAGVGDGEYQLGDKKVIVSGGKAVLADGGSIAGSSLTMDRALARAVREVGLPIEVASAAASGTPARVLGGADRFGAIAVGLDADLVVLDDDLAVARVMAQGRWAAGEKV